MAFDRPGMEIGFLQADQDFSDESHQWTAVWIGVGSSGSTVSGNAAILKHGGEPSDSGSGSAPTPAQDQIDDFTVADGGLTVGSHYGFDINGQTVSVTATTGETLTQVLTALGNAAEAKDANISFAVTDTAGQGKLEITATTSDAITYANFVNVAHTNQQAAAPAGSGSGGGSGSPSEAGQIKGGAVGILQNRPIKGEACNVMVSGVSEVRAGSDWLPGDELGTDDSGAVVKASSGPILGLAIEAAAEGDVSSILLLPRTAA